VKLRVLIVDDEAPARQRIRAVLAHDPEVEVVAECSNGLAAVEAIRSHKPHLVFLDVQMPGLDGFAVLEQLEPATLPQVVFVTAFERHAVQAFTAHALGFVLKPFKRARLEESVRRALAVLRSGTAAESLPRLVSLLETIRHQRGYPERIVIKTEGRHIFLPVAAVEWIGAEGDYVQIHTAKKSYLVRERMRNLERRFDPQRFIRIHRSTIVNLDHVAAVYPGVGGEPILKLRNETELTVGRHYRPSIQRLLDSAL
jgi:two-component system LytT family response regulator